MTAVLGAWTRWSRGSRRAIRRWRPPDLPRKATAAVGADLVEIDLVDRSGTLFQRPFRWPPCYRKSRAVSRTDSRGRESRTAVRPTCRSQNRLAIARDGARAGSIEGKGGTVVARQGSPAILTMLAEPPTGIDLVEGESVSASWRAGAIACFLHLFTGPS